MNKKLTIASVIAAIVVMPTFAVDDPVSGDKRTTSQPYVEAQIETTQIKIPAANPSNTNIGDTVITYTNVDGGGVIGERELFTGGEYDADSDSGKLITASALNTAFTNLPTTDTTKLVCANQSDGCTLWTITDQTAYGISGNGTTTVDLMSLIGNVESVNEGYVYLGGSGYNMSTYGLTQDGTFVVDYGDGKRIRGKSQCSMRGVSSPWSNSSSYTFSSDDFASTLPDASGDNCWCQLDGYTTNGDNWGNMTALSAPWVIYVDLSDYGICDRVCAELCTEGLGYTEAVHLAFRAAMFNSVQ